MADTHDIKELDEVEILKTGEHAIVVWIDEDDKKLEHDSFLLEVIGKDEMPDFYHRNEFRFVKR